MSNTIYTYFCVYKITNIINNKIYIGIHKTNDLNDQYMGSGKLLNKAKTKYGIENFKKEILFVYDNKEEMFAKEKELVNEEFILNEMTYNLKIGGEGGWDHIYNSNLTDEHKLAISKGLRKAYDNGLKPRLGLVTNGFLGKSHSEESKKKISENNGRSLSSEEEKRRKDIYESIDFSKRGCIKKFSEALNVSHTQARRIKQDMDNALPD